MDETSLTSTGWANKQRQRVEKRRTKNTGAGPLRGVCVRVRGCGCVDVHLYKLRLPTWRTTLTEDRDDLGHSPWVVALLLALF